MILALSGCVQPDPAQLPEPPAAISLLVLGTLQDGGSPHAGCTRPCCADLFTNPDPMRTVVSLGVIDPVARKAFLFEATPDLPSQMKMLKRCAPFSGEAPDGIFLTHAHIGHYAGLIYLGREAMSADSVPAYTMPRMQNFLAKNGPWSQLVELKNITLCPLSADSTLRMTDDLSVTPFIVPHRDEFSETVGYRIEGPNHKALFIPDIDKWETWERSIVTEIANVDYAFLDATFFDGTELHNRDMSEIPHPFLVESMEQFNDLPASERGKIYFIHFNHTNPVLDGGGDEARAVRDAGYNLAEPGLMLPL
jgi:pyrroloquinoline quinone biosynthesis protein B